MPNAKIDNEWIRCWKCGHKLGKRLGDWNERNSFPLIEVKCNSCKSLNLIPCGDSSQSKPTVDDFKDNHL